MPKIKLQFKYTFLAILFLLLLAACGPLGVAPAATETATAAQTATPTPISTPTPRPPDNIANVSNLSKWIDDYVHAYGGIVSINGVEMDADKLADTVRKTGEQFTLGRTVNGIDYSFLMINGVPLASRRSGEKWEKVTIKILADLLGLKIGSFFGGNNTTDQDFQNILKIQKQEFNLGAIYQGMNCCVENQRGVFTLDVTRSLLREAKNNNMSILFHPLIWSWEIPSWLSSEESKSVWSDSLNGYVRTVMAELEGSNAFVVVVNEYRNPQDIIYQELGKDYLESAFSEARAASPTSTLIYNDYDNETATGGRYQLTMDVVQTLREKFLLDGVGLQMHLSGSNPPAKDEVILAMKSYGLPIYITEFDVNMKDVQGDTIDRMVAQAQIYKSIIDACIESGVCKYIVPFQIGDKFSVWENDTKFGAYSKNADPTIYDDSLRPKPAYYAIVQSLYEHLP